MESRCEGAANKYGLRRGKVSYAGMVPLTQVPPALWKIYLSALEEAIRVGEAVIKDRTISNHQIVRFVKFYLYNGYQPNAIQTSFDDHNATLNITVTLLSPTGRSVHFKHEDTDVIVQMVLQAFNDKSKELPLDTKLSEATRKISLYLRPPSSELEQEPFVIKHRFSDGRDSTVDLKDRNGLWRKYFSRYITPASIEDMFAAIRQIAESKTLSVNTAPFGGSTSSAPADAAPLQANAGYPLSPGADVLQNLTPMEILSEMLLGVIIELPATSTSAIVTASEEERILTTPPKLFAIRRQGEGRTEMTLVRTQVALNRFRAIIGGHAKLDSFGQQLQDIVLQVQVASQCSLAEERINVATGCREKCVVNWNSLMSAFSKSAADHYMSSEPTSKKVGEEHVPAIIHAVGAAYCHRIEAAIEKLKSELAPPSAWVGLSFADPSPTLYEVGYLRCVAGNTLVFSEGRPATHISRGLLGEIASVSVRSASDKVADALPYTNDPSLPTFHLSFYSPLGDWMKTHFLDSNGIHDVAPQFDGNGIALDEQQLQQNDQQLLDMKKEEYLTQQENVAIARSSEISVLRMMDITRIVSDRQRQVHIEDSGAGGVEFLRASDAVIYAGVKALDECFMDGKSSTYNNGKLIDKQDIVKILSVSLFRLRVLFKGEISPIGASPTTANDTHLNVAQATAVLKNFCDYKESETCLIPGPDNRLFRLHREKGDTSDIASARFSFDEVALIALTNLLPNETRLAALARRDILVVGLENSGKSTIINHIRHQTGKETLATIGIAETFVAFKEWVFSFKELGGRVDFRKNWREYFKTLGHASIHGVMVVVDVQDIKRFGDVRNFMHEVVTDKLCRGVPVLFVLNHHEETEGITAMPTVSTPTPVNGLGQAPKRKAHPATKSKKYTTSKIESKLDIKDTAKGHRHQLVYCNVTHMSSDKEIDQALARGLQWFCDELAEKTPLAQRPKAPKEGFEE